MIRHHAESNNILLTRNIPIDSVVSVKPSFNDTIALRVG